MLAVGILGGNGKRPARQDGHQLVLPFPVDVAVPMVDLG